MIDSEYAICCQSLSVQVQQQTLISDLTCRIKQGQITGLIGSNGAGKSTLIKTIVGLVPLTKGGCSIFGEDCRRPSTRRHLTFLPEKFHVAPALTGRDFLQGMNRFTSPDQWEDLCQVLNFVPAWLDKSIKFYSKGMLQKLGLIYFLASNKPLLIADELMSGLDMKTRAAVHSYLHKLQKQGCTILFSTHMPHDIFGLCDEVILLEQGEIQFAGQANQLSTDAFT